MKPERKYWLDDPRHVKWVVWAVYGACILVLALEPLYHKHGDFGWEEWPAFHAFFGFAVFAVLVLAGKQLRRLLMRDEDYYDR